MPSTSVAAPLTTPSSLVLIGRLRLLPTRPLTLSLLGKSATKLMRRLPRRPPPSILRPVVKVGLSRLVLEPSSLPLGRLVVAVDTGLTRLCSPRTGSLDTKVRHTDAAPSTSKVFSQLKALTVPHSLVGPSIRPF